MLSGTDPTDVDDAGDASTSLDQARAAELADACGDGENPGFVCEWVFDATDGNERLAQLADWFIGRPLVVLLILVVAWIVSRLARRAADRVIRQVVTRGPSIGRKKFEMLGLEAPTMLVGDDDEEMERRSRAEARAKSISAVIGSAITIVVWTIAIFTILGELGIQLGPLIASAGIAGVALGFGAQSLVKDCISGLFILLEDQYGIGDVVDVGEATGVVEETSLRTTVLRSLDGTVWHVPNGEITRVGNMSQLWSMALVDVDVAYDADIQHAEDVVLDTANQLCAEDEWTDDIIEDPVLLGVERLGADGVTIRLVVKCSPGSQWALQRKLRERIKQSLDAAGIEIPFPQRTLWIRSQQ
ncbi:MAG: mechanosensitive ion channel family protein [Actinomycetota bacterium]